MMFPPDDAALSVFAVWFRSLRSTYLGFGHELANMIGIAGLTDNVARADRILAAAEDLGWIVRGDNPEPGRHLMFFGVGGLAWPEVARNRNALKAHPVVYGFSPGHGNQEAATKFLELWGKP